MSPPPNMYFAPSVLRFNAKTVVRRGEVDKVARAVDVIKSVTRNTRIPIPRFLEKGVDSAGRGYFKMEYIVGDTIRNAWETMSDC